MASYKWYKEIGLQYLLSEVPDFTSDEINYLLQNSDKKYNVEKGFTGAFNKGLVFKYYNEDEKGVSLTDEGIRIIKAVNTGLSMPKLEYVRKFIDFEWFQRGKTQKELIEKTELNHHTLTKICQGYNSKPVKVSDIKRIVETLNMDLNEFFKNIRRLKMYYDFNIQYGRKTDPFLSDKEIEILMRKDYLGTYISKNLQVELGLRDKGLLNIRQNNETKETINFLSDDGIKLYLDIYERQSYYPELDDIIDVFHSERVSKHWTVEDLSEKSGVEIDVIVKLEQRLNSYKKSFPFAYIEDLKKIYDCLKLNFKDQVNKLREIELQKKKEESRLRTLKSQNNKINNNVPKIETHSILSNQEYKILISESPIETKLLKEIIKLKDTYDFEIDTQVEFTVNSRNYRAEIFIEFKDEQGNKRKILVECDGHDFHEKTKDQAQKDKQRDRDFLSAGIITLRFTGSEIWKNAKDCAEEIFQTYNGFQSAISK